jgi:hypothetical protein
MLTSDERLVLDMPRLRSNIVARRDGNPPLLAEGLPDRRQQGVAARYSLLKMVNPEDAARARREPPVGRSKEGQQATKVLWRTRPDPPLQGGDTRIQGEGRPITHIDQRNAETGRPQKLRDVLG